MKKILILLGIGLILVLVIAIISRGPVPVPPPNDQPDELRLATWNLEWFGALGRSPDDIREIAAIIRELKLDIVALQEITCPCTLENLAEELDFQWYISPQRIPQKLALIWAPGKVKNVFFDENAYRSLEKVAFTGLSSESRQPLVFRLQSGAFDFSLIVVHLKAIPEAERSVEIRNVQYDAINRWLADELARPGAEEDIMIAGDFNAFRSGISSERLLAAGYVEFATDTLGDDEYSNIWYDRDGDRNLSFIDHIALTPSLRQEEFREILPIRDWDKNYPADAFERRISDHLPLVAIFDTTRDLD
ncbi:MAG: endonuclease/exonuclease/phosphatase family protein [Acidobacteria bacterium]|nr:endonuclease/exonuclease/phosphatase family protein [Acidobacteriota bacterium]